MASKLGQRDLNPSGLALELMLIRNQNTVFLFRACIQVFALQRTWPPEYETIICKIPTSQDCQNDYMRI